MGDFRIPGPQCSSRYPLFDDGTLCLRLTPTPPPVCRADGSDLFPKPPQRQWHLMSKQGGFPPSSLALGPEGAKLLKAIETLRLKPYNDDNDKEITAWVDGATIGYGHLIQSSEWGTYKDGITEGDADTLFLKDAQRFVDAVSNTIKVGLQQYEFDALVMLAFNTGPSGFKNSSVAKLINDPEASTGYADLEAAWKAWNKTDGKFSQGLANRRQAEWTIYTTGVYARW